MPTLVSKKVQPPSQPSGSMVAVMEYSRFWSVPPMTEQK